MRQISVTTVTDKMVDEKKMPRKLAASQVCLFRLIAKNKPRMTSAGTVNTAK